MEFIISAPKSSIAFYVANFPVRFYGLIMAFSIFLGFVCIFTYIESKYNKLEADKFFDYSPILVVLSIVGARLFYVVGAYKYYLNFPKEILMLNHGGISIWGAVLFGIGSLYLLSKINKFNFLQHLDSIALFMPLCQSVGRFGNYFNQEAFGLPSNCFMKLFVDISNRPDQYRNIDYFHPTFLYESILDLIIFILLFTFFRKSKSGIIVSLYLICYSIARILIECIRIDSILTIKGIPIAIVISFIMLILGSLLLYYSIKKQ